MEETVRSLCHLSMAVWHSATGTARLIQERGKKLHSMGHYQDNHKCSVIVCDSATQFHQVSLTRYDPTLLHPHCQYWLDKAIQVDQRTRVKHLFPEEVLHLQLRHQLALVSFIVPREALSPLQIQVMPWSLQDSLERLLANVWLPMFFQEDRLRRLSLSAFQSYDALKEAGYQVRRKEQQENRELEWMVTHGQENIQLAMGPLTDSSFVLVDQGQMISVRASDATFLKPNLSRKEKRIDQELE